MTILSGIATSNQPVPATPLIPAGSPPSGLSLPSFQNLLDAVNPLQHIPVISSLYRAGTGSAISTGAQLAGDTLYGVLMGGGVLGIATSVGSAVANAAVTQATGSDIAANMLNVVSPSTGTLANATSLTPDSGQSALINAQIAGQAGSTPQFLPLSKQALATAGDYQRAQVNDIFDKKLLKMVS